VRWLRDLIDCKIKSGAGVCFEVRITVRQLSA
jgi:hypothetical protein